MSKTKRYREKITDYLVRSGALKPNHCRKGRKYYWLEVDRNQERTTDAEIHQLLGCTSVHKCTHPSHAHPIYIVTLETVKRNGKNQKCYLSPSKVYQSLSMKQISPKRLMSTTFRSMKNQHQECGQSFVVLPNPQTQATSGSPPSLPLLNPQTESNSSTQASLIERPRQDTRSIESIDDRLAKLEEKCSRLFSRVLTAESRLTTITLLEEEWQRYRDLIQQMLHRNQPQFNYNRGSGYH